MFSLIPSDANAWMPKAHIKTSYDSIANKSPHTQCVVYEGCSNMNASRFITFFTYMLRQNGKRFYKGLYVIFKLAPGLKKNTVYLSS